MWQAFSLYRPMCLFYNYVNLCPLKEEFKHSRIFFLELVAAACFISDSEFRRLVCRDAPGLEVVDAKLSHPVKVRKQRTK